MKPGAVWAAFGRMTQVRHGPVRGSRTHVAGRAALTLALVLGMSAGAAAQFPRWDVQLPEGAGSYPKGSIFIQDLDSIWTATGEVLARASIPDRGWRDSGRSAPGFSRRRGVCRGRWTRLHGDSRDR